MAKMLKNMKNFAGFGIIGIRFILVETLFIGSIVEHNLSISCADHAEQILHSVSKNVPPLQLAIIFTARRNGNARIASAVLAIAIPSVRPSVHHTPVLCQNDGT